MKGNFHVRFLEEGEGAISPSYSAMFLDTKVQRLLLSFAFFAFFAVSRCN